MHRRLALVKLLPDWLTISVRMLLRGQLRENPSRQMETRCLTDCRECGSLLKHPLITTFCKLTLVAPAALVILLGRTYGDSQRTAGCVPEEPWRTPVHQTYDSNLVDPASSHTLVSKIKPCMCKYKQIYTVKLRTAHYISYSLFDNTLLLG